MVQQFGATPTGGAVVSISMSIASIGSTGRTLSTRIGTTIPDIAATSHIAMPMLLSVSAMATARLLATHFAARQRRAAVTWRRKLARLVRLLPVRLLKPKLALRPSPGLLPRRRSMLARPSLQQSQSLRPIPIAPRARKVPAVPLGHSTLAGQKLQAIGLRREPTRRCATPRDMRTVRAWADAGAAASERPDSEAAEVEAEAAGAVVDAGPTLRSSTTLFFSVTSTTALDLSVCLQRFQPSLCRCIGAGSSKRRPEAVVRGSDGY